MGKILARRVCFFFFLHKLLNNWAMCVLIPNWAHSFIHWIRLAAERLRPWFARISNGNNNCNTLTSPEYSQNMYNTPHFPSRVACPGQISHFGRKSNCQLAKLFSISPGRCVYVCWYVLFLWGKNSWTNWIYRYSVVLTLSRSKKKIELSFAGASDLIRFGAVRVRTQISGPPGGGFWVLPSPDQPLPWARALAKVSPLLGNKHKRLT